MIKDINFCKERINLMLKRSQTKVIFPIITLGLLNEFQKNNKDVFTDLEVKSCYEDAVKFIKEFLGHDFHVGAKYYDAYPSRNLPKYGVLKALDNKIYQILPPFTTNAKELTDWIKEIIKLYIDEKLGIIPRLANRDFRVKISESDIDFMDLIKQHIDKNPTNFEICSFAILKVHLEKFACRIYRDTKTAATDKGVDLSTNYGVVYQIKKLKIVNQREANILYEELKGNFDMDRIKDGNIVIIIDDICKEIRNYLINMKIQSISKQELMKLVCQFDDIEDREKVLHIIYKEFRREYSSNI